MYEIKNFQPRIYQETILNTASKANTLIVLPTGLGKTKTAILIAIQRLNNFPNSRILFLTPTKPLAAQIQKEFKESTNISEVALFTGHVPPEKREILFKESRVIVSTPQGLSNDIINNRINLNEISCIFFDECHRATGDYDYVWIAKQYHGKAQFPRLIGLTASPGSDLESIEEICKNLYIEEIEIRTEEDEDVKPYVQEMDIDWVNINLSDELKQIQKYLSDCYKSKLQKLKDIGLISSISDITKTQILELQKKIHTEIAHGEKDIQLWQGISLVAEALKVEHALGLLETQGLKQLHKYQSDIYEEAKKGKTKAIKNLVMDLNFKSAYVKSQILIENNIDHPKIEELKKIISREISPEKKIIIFTQYRDTGAMLEEELNNIPGVSAKLFVGQTKKGSTGISQKKQLEMIQEFKENKFNVICMTSVGEEGLDIPEVDLVIFFEPIPSAIRTIQRRGRTARQKEGKVIVLMTKNTRDEAYRWTSYHKEKRMYAILNQLKDKIHLKKHPEKTLNDYTMQENKLKVYADNREKSSGIIKELIDLGVEIETKNLASADYVISSDIAIELKTKEDFLQSIVDGRLLQQIKELRNNYQIPLLVLQGSEDIYSLRKIHPNAIRGMLSTIAISYNVPIIPTVNHKDTAALIYNIAKRVAESEEKKEFSLRTERKPLTTKQQQEFIIESLPNIGPNVAKSLLKEFRTIKKIVNAEKEDLEKVDLVGPKKSEEIIRIINEVYEGD